MILAIAVVLVSALALSVRLFLARWARFMERSVEEIGPFLTMVNDYADEIELRLDPRWQRELGGPSGPGYRDAVHRAIRFLKEMVGRERQNVLVLNEYARTEHSDTLRLARAAAAGLQQMRAEQRQMQRELQRAPQPAGAEGDWAAGPDATPEQLIELEQAILVEIEHREMTLRHLEALKNFIALSGWLLSAMRWPLWKLTVCSLVPYEKWPLVPVPRLASFGRSGEIHLTEAFKNVKTAGMELIDLLHPCAGVLRDEIESQM
ncbi:MAG TPA: hypothetical protein VNW97_14645 [Candidatus Saccharimonadales bacterium]|jgi:hypothetical protein|nr:hypothetical protein [Candidatus Saccharimonadales bacterium]